MLGACVHSLHIHPQTSHPIHCTQTPWRATEFICKGYPQPSPLHALPLPTLKWPAMSSMTSSSHLATPSQDKSSAPLQPSNSSVSDPNSSSMKLSSRKPHSLSLSLVHSSPPSSSSIQKTPSNGELRILDSHVPEDDPLSDEEDDTVPCTKVNGTKAKDSADVRAQNEPALSTSGASFSTVETAESETSSQSAALFHSGDEHILNQINRSVSFDRDSLEFCNNSQSEESADDSEDDTDDGSISTSDQSDEDSDSEDDHESFSDTHSILSDGYVSAPSFCDEDSPMASSFSPLSEKFMSSTARYSYSDTDNSEPPTPTQPHLNTSLGLPTAQTSGSKIPSDQESDYHSAQSSVQAPTSVSPRKELSIETSGLLQSQETDPSLSTPKNQSSVNITVTQSSPLREHSTNSRSPATLSPFISAMIVSTHTETLDDAEWEKEKKSISVKHIVKPKTKNYTVYRLLVKTADAEYNLDKRYSEMAWLQAKFTKHYPNARLPTFPPKKIFVFTIPELIQSPYFFEFFNPPENHEFVKPFEATPECFAARALSADSLSPPPSNASSLTSSPRLSPGLSPLTPNPIQPVDFSMDTPSLNANSTIFPSLPPSAISPGSPTKKKKGLSKVAYKTGKMLKRSITGGSGDKLLVDINDSAISKPAPLNLNKTVTRGSSTSRSKRKRKHKKKPSEDRRSNSAAAALNTQETKSEDAMALIETSKTHNEDHGFKSDSSAANSLTPLTKKADDEFALQLPLVDSIQKRQAKKKAKKELKKKKMLMEAVNESGELVVAESKVDGKEADTGFPIYDAIQKRQAKRKAKRKLKKLAKEKELNRFVEKRTLGFGVYFSFLLTI
ncbi:hypothetical protein BKA69DRAFT_705071 [Paraphysoderma sedebokerense]|nr:hypothetical protein BKA69DRAFT_705071 [Paraphysoderma sedebokerense]